MSPKPRPQPRVPRLWEKSGPQGFGPFPPQLCWDRSSGWLETALGLRAQPSALLQNCSCVHIKAFNERKMPFLAPCARSADAVWQAERASTVWRPEGRKEGCESDLGPSPSAWTALLIALTNTEILGQLGARGWGREQPQFPLAPAGMRRGPLGRARGPGQRRGFASSSCPRADESPVHPHHIPEGFVWEEAGI